MIGSLLLPTLISAQSYQQLAPNYFVAGIPTTELEYRAAPQKEGRQRQMNWCWAACIQMTLNYHGLSVTQEQLVKKIYGGLYDAPAGPVEIMNALNGWAPNSQGGYSIIKAQYGVYSVDDIINHVAYKQPIIVGLEQPNNDVGHAYVLTAVYYTVNAYNQPIIQKVVLRDPWPLRPSRQELSWPQFVARNPQFFKVWVQNQ